MTSVRGSLLRGRFLLLASSVAAELLWRERVVRCLGYVVVWAAPFVDWAARSSPLPHLWRASNRPRLSASVDEASTTDCSVGDDEVALSCSRHNFWVMCGLLGPSDTIAAPHVIYLGHSRSDGRFSSPPERPVVSWWTTTRVDLLGRSSALRSVPNS